ncbi:MAG TPA: cytochrome C oxidase subunit IV family protein [Candidatus Acidoferrales bacterium]|nr:cytochrome C oxidase subunit IV family protein [Candidatus Acidoferrales bacterium]
MNTNHHQIPPRNVFIAIWFALIVLLFTMFGLSHLKYAAAGTPIILIAAVIQMLLVLSFFMRLRHSAKLVRLTSLAGFCWLLFLFILAFSDYLTREWH